jgi:hypothetical protein
MLKKKADKEPTANVALPASVHAKLRAAAADLHQPISYLASQAVIRFLETRDGQPV